MTRSELLVVCVVGLAVAALLATAGEGATGAGRAPGRAASGEAWDLVWITDSSGWGVAPLYARRIEQARGVRVRVHDEWVGGLRATNILARLRSPSDRWVRLIRAAEAVVVYGSPQGLEIVKGGDCVTRSDPPLVVGPRAWPRFIVAMKTIYERIFEIRKGEPLVLRTTTQYVPIIHRAPSSPFFPQKSWDAAGVTRRCTRKFEWYSWAISKAAFAYDVPVADVYTAFNGKTHLGDPVAKGYIQPDGVHPSNKGRRVIATTLADLGYEPVGPAR